MPSITAHAELSTLSLAEKTPVRRDIATKLKTVERDTT